MAALIQNARELEIQGASFEDAIRLREAVQEWDPGNVDNLLALVALSVAIEDDWRVMIHVQATIEALKSDTPRIQSTFQFCFETPLRMLLKHEYYDAFFNLSHAIVEVLVPQKEQSSVYAILHQLAIFYSPKQVSQFQNLWTLFDLFTEQAKDTLDFLLKGTTLKGFSLMAERLESLAKENQDDPKSYFCLLSEAIKYYNQSAQRDKARSIIEDLLEQWPPERLQTYIPNSPETAQDEMTLILFKSFAFRICYNLSYLSDDRKRIRTYQKIADKGLSRIYLHYQKTDGAKSLDRSQSYRELKDISSRPLRVGYIGLCFGMHSVGFLSHQTITQHDPCQVQSYCYSVINRPDPEDFIYQSFKEKTYRFYDLHDQPWGVVIKTIQNDDLDILVLMDGSTTEIGYQVLPYRPAWIQMSWLGGDAPRIPELDYFLVDPYILPEDAQADYDETLLRLPTFAAVDDFRVSELEPVAMRERLKISPETVVFWSAANAPKRNPQSINAHLTILKEVPDSVLVVKGLGDFATVREVYSEQAEMMDIQHKLRFVEVTRRGEDHRAQFLIADLVLDTFPYTGATHTFEALYMGTPVLTLVGRHYYGRMSYSLLKNCQLDDCITYSVEEYIERGIALGSNRDRLAQVKAQVQGSRSSSPIWDAKGFACTLETTYRQVVTEKISKRF